VTHLQCPLAQAPQVGRALLELWWHGLKWQAAPLICVGRPFLRCVLAQPTEPPASSRSHGSVSSKASREAVVEEEVRCPTHWLGGSFAR
jgi:hypothetical protein